MVGYSQYVEVVVNGKTGTRPVPLINSIPYLKDYLDHEHPQPRNPKSEPAGLSVINGFSAAVTLVLNRYSYQHGKTLIITGRNFY
jgi:hypothetical protein